MYEEAPERPAITMTAHLFDLQGKTAVVIGGTSGIGRVLALGLADAGADVVATARRETLVNEVAAEIERRGRRTMRVPTDVSDEAALGQLRDLVVREFGQIDVVLTAAGITRRAPTLEMDTAEWQNIIDVNLMGTLRAFKAFAPPMIARRSGRLIGVASLSSFVLSLFMTALFKVGGGFQFVELGNWIPSLGIHYHLGVDGLSLPLIVLTALLSLLSVAYSWRIEMRNCWRGRAGRSCCCARR